MSDNLDKKRNFALVLIIILIGLALVTVWSKEPEAKRGDVILPIATPLKASDTPQPTMTTMPTVTSAATPTQTPTQYPPTVTPIPTSTPVPTVVIQLHGQLVLTTEMIEGLIHEFYIKMEEQIKVQVREEGNGMISFEGEPPWVDVSGIISPTGVISATGIGVVAGYPDTSVWVTGTLENDYFVGALTMGTEHELPGGEPGVYIIQGPYEAHPLQVTPTPSLVIDVGSAVTVTFETFINDFNYAMQNGGTEWLYDHLHPAVLERYDPDACLIYLGRTVQPEFEIIVNELSGPDVWSWDVDGLVLDIENAYTAESVLTIKGDIVQSEVHFALVNGQFRWFTTCDNPDE